MVGCACDSCNGDLWFHLECVNEQYANLPSGDWYCSETCKQLHSEEVDLASDSVLEYSRAVLFFGLGEMARCHPRGQREKNDEQLETRFAAYLSTSSLEVPH